MYTLDLFPTHTVLGDGSHPTDVDLGTLGSRPFAMRDEDTRKTSSFSVTLEPISETSETDVVSPLTSVARENMSSPEFQESPQNGSQIGFHLSTGSSSSVVDKSSSGRDERASSGGVGAHAGSCDQSPANLSIGQVACDGEIEEVDLGEIGSGDTCEIDTNTARTETRMKGSANRTDKSQKSALKENRRSSFLIPFFNRRDSFTPSFVKPSQSALYQKAARKGMRRGASEGAIQQAEESQQEVPEDLSSDDREKLLEDLVEDEELSLTRRLFKRAGQSIKSSLFDLRLFLW